MCYAIEIPLQGEIKRVAQIGVQKVKGDLGLNKEIESFKPHICLSAGWCSNEKLLCAKFEKIAERCSSFQINSYGLGVFITEKPVIYIRWLQSTKLMSFFRDIYADFSQTWSRLYPNYHEEMWIPKASLFTDGIDYSQLASILRRLKEFDFKQSMIVDKLTLDRIDEKNVVTLKEIKLQSI